MSETADYKKGAPRYDPAVKYNWKLMTVPDLAYYHICIVDKMTELGMAGIPERVNNFANNDSEAGARTCRTLDQRVKEFLAGVDKRDESAPAEEAAAPKRGAAGSKTKPERAPSKAAKRSAAPERETASEEKTKMARAKSTKGRKVGASKKAAATARVRTAYDPNAKIHVLPEGKPNPRREGTTAWKNYQKILESSGKTFGHYVEKGGRVPTLTRAVKEKIVKVA